MPFIHVELLEGRTPEQKKALIEDITEVVSKDADVPKERIHVIIRDMKHGDYGCDGEVK